MKLLLLLALSASASFAAIGDHAPPVPTTLCSAHPCMTVPDNAYLNTVYTNRAGTTAYIFNAANAFTGPPSETSYDCRYLLIAYLANKLNGGATATYLTALKNQSRTAWGAGSTAGSFCEAMTYDWIFADLDATTKANFLADLQAYSTDWETTQVPTFSPFNDTGYIRGAAPPWGMILAIAQHPEGGATSLTHLRWAMDWYFNIVLPVWKHQFTSGCWHETWEYTSQPTLNDMYPATAPNLLAWAQATGNYPGFFTTDNPWLINTAYCAIYQLRPDWTLDRMNGSANGGWIEPEYLSGANGISQPGIMEMIAEAYKSTTYGTTLRYFARQLDWGGNVPTGFEPSAFPYLTPDSSANTAASSFAALPTVKAFTTGWGYLALRTGWGENDTACWIRFGDHYWSHDIQDIGAFDCYSRGGLAIRSGSYQPGSASQHYYLYGKQARSQNVMLFLDGTANSGNDFYSTETVPVSLSNGTVSNTAMPNDGGQRRVGSGFQCLPNCTGTLPQVMEVPYELPEWYREHEIMHGGDLEALSINSTYTFACVDLAPAYNNLYSHGTHSGTNYDQANTSNRTYRVQKYVRCFLWIPRGTAAYLVVYDQAVTSASTILKQWQLHTIDLPTISSNSFTVQRNVTITRQHPDWLSAANGGTHGLSNCAGSCGVTTSYVYAGELDGWMTLAGNAPFSGSTSTLCSLGGIGTHDFDIGGRCSQSTFGTNYNGCMQTQCTSSVGTGPVADILEQVDLGGPSEPGAYRIEEEVGANHTDDWFLNVMLFRNISDTNTVSTAPVTTASGTNWSTTWKDNTNACTYTLVLPKYGVGGTITATGTCTGGNI